MYPLRLYTDLGYGGSPYGEHSTASKSLGASSGENSCSLLKMPILERRNESF